MGMKHNQFVDRNIVILFDDYDTFQLVKLSKQINKRVPSEVVLNTRDTIPHLSVYDTKFPARNIERVSDILTRLVKGCSPFVIKFSKPSIRVETIFIEAQFSKELQALHEIVVDEINFLREGVYNEEVLESPDFTDDMRQS